MTKVLVNLLQTTGKKGGIEIYAQELYRQIGRMTTEFEFVALASRELSERGADWFPGELINSGISGENRFTWAWGELFNVSKVAKKLEVDLIHGPAMFGPLRPPVPTVISIHDVLYFSHPRLMSNKFYILPVMAMEFLGAKAASKIITISEYSSRGIVKYLGIPNQKIDVIPLAGRISGLDTQPPRERNGAFLAIGQRSPYKNLETVIHGWARIPENIRPQLVVTGSHGSDPLSSLVERHDLRKWVTLKSWVSTTELEELFGSAPALIDSTLATGFSMPTLEAMSRRLPVILADTEVFREVGGNAAAYFEAGSSESLSRKVIELLENPSDLELLAKSGLERSKQFSWEMVASKTLQTFRETLGTSRKSP
jgi:alpha-1,3-rhamnosyl/mannosyltransferase